MLSRKVGHSLKKSPNVPTFRIWPEALPSGKGKVGAGNRDSFGALSQPFPRKDMPWNVDPWPTISVLGAKCPRVKSGHFWEMPA